jgi:hypothetical protein
MSISPYKFHSIEFILRVKLYIISVYLEVLVMQSIVPAPEEQYTAFMCTLSFNYKG